jgi:hypothetical protein
MRRGAFHFRNAPPRQLRVSAPSYTSRIGIYGGSGRKALFAFAYGINGGVGGGEG